MFRREHHRDIAWVLNCLDGDLLRSHHCYFGGGTAIVLLHKEFRESVDIDFMVSDAAAFREMRDLARRGFDTLLKSKEMRVKMLRDWRIDQYGIRTQLGVGQSCIKFEIIREARVEFECPGSNDTICGVSTLSALDLVTTKLLANSDRWADAGVFSRDLIDLAMMLPSQELMRDGLAKASVAYGKSVSRDLHMAVERLGNDPEILDRCISALSMEQPRALLWKRIRRLAKLIPVES